MARSTYVYTVTVPGTVPPVAAFTVKRELGEWLEKADREGLDPHRQVWSQWDNQPGLPTRNMTAEFPPGRSRA